MQAPLEKIPDYTPNTLVHFTLLMDTERLVYCTLYTTFRVIELIDKANLNIGITQKDDENNKALHALTKMYPTCNRINLINKYLPRFFAGYLKLRFNLFPVFWLVLSSGQCVCFVC